MPALKVMIGAAIDMAVDACVCVGKKRDRRGDGSCQETTDVSFRSKARSLGKYCTTGS